MSNPVPSSPPPGWYSDGPATPGLRWWDGSAWTEHRHVVDAAPEQKKPRLRPTVSTWVVGAILALFLFIGLASGGASGFLITLGIAAFLTGIYSVVFGRTSWALIPSRKVGAAVLGGALVLTIAGGAVAAPSPSASLAASVVEPTDSPSPSAKAPSVAFTAEEPADPKVATTPESDSSVAIESSADTDATAFSVLATLPVKGRAPMTGYARVADFGAAWLDVDRNGCDTRNDILSRDLTGTTMSGSCRVLTGELANPYLGTSMSFVRGSATSALVQIDHVVSLGDAWQTGAQQLTSAQRISLANDPINLLAVDARSNDQKGAGDAATWLPANKSFRCEYVARQISVKATYGLWVTTAEGEAMARVLASCPDQRAFTSSFAPAPVVVAAPEIVAPAPAPVVVAPAPAAPAPAAPKPAAPAPAAPALVSPGAFCPDAAVGQSGVAANGKTYTCGSKGADAKGHYHWNS
ncbi:DUF1524 domain-containing protein [Lacisediminihabitans sp. H27-G8]|uniref:GmrSD restriction endonuclease domain-containing protein n=1 Tax=Lacisediminihabitans sp. H27-G8 TaxID=3111909 RepID=UPI0038FD32EA